MSVLFCVCSVLYTYFFQFILFFMQLLLLLCASLCLFLFYLYFSLRTTSFLLFTSILFSFDSVLFFFIHWYYFDFKWILFFSCLMLIQPKSRYVYFQFMLFSLLLLLTVILFIEFMSCAREYSSYLYWWSVISWKIFDYHLICYCLLAFFFSCNVTYLCIYKIHINKAFDLFVKQFYFKNLPENNNSKQQCKKICKKYARIDEKITNGMDQNKFFFFRWKTTNSSQLISSLMGQLKWLQQSHVNKI